MIASLSQAVLVETLHDNYKWMNYWFNSGGKYMRHFQFRSPCGRFNTRGLLARTAALPGSHPSSRRNSSTTGHAKELTWYQLFKASKLAHWSGFCYQPNSNIADLVKAEGLEFVASGRTHYTSWFVADGCIDYKQLIRSLPSGHDTSQLLHPSGHDEEPSDSTHDLHSTHMRIPKPQKTRFVFIRGVHWAAPDANNTAISTALMNFWPSAFPPAPATGDQPIDQPLVSHTGVTQLAVDLYKQISKYLTPTARTAHTSSNKAADSKSPTSSSKQTSSSEPASHASALTNHDDIGSVCIAGHSLGGALGMLVMANHIMYTAQASGTSKHAAASQHLPHISCHTFGSPPVLAHRDGGGGHKVLQSLGLPDKAVRSFVLEHDPVPRALLTADPAFAALKQYPIVQQLLEARGWLFGTGGGVASMIGNWLGGAAASSSTSSIDQNIVSPVFSPNRFVFENVGSVWLMKGVAELIPVGDASDVEDLLRLAATDFMAQPAKALQAWLDHHHGSYAHDLEIAALASLKRQLRSAKQAALAQQEKQRQAAMLHTHHHPSPLNLTHPVSGQDHNHKHGVDVHRRLTLQPHHPQHEQQAKPRSNVTTGAVFGGSDVGNSADNTKADISKGLKSERADSPQATNDGGGSRRYSTAAATVRSRAAGQDEMAVSSGTMVTPHQPRYCSEEEVHRMMYVPDQLYSDAVQVVAQHANKPALPSSSVPMTMQRDDGKDLVAGQVADRPDDTSVPVDGSKQMVMARAVKS